MRKRLILCLLLPLAYVAEAQKDHLVDSLKKNLSGASNDGDKVYALMDLCNYYTGLDQQLSKSYIEQALEVAEMSRDRKLMSQTCLRAGDHWLGTAGLKDNIVLAMDCFQRAEKVARENDLNDELGYAYIGMARVTRGRGD